MIAIYFLIAIGATTIGAITGMGGGVFIKPILDLMGTFDVTTISALSTITVFFMSITSVFRQRNSDQKPEATIALPLALGAVLGGNLGGVLLSQLIGGMTGSSVTLIQNAILALLIVLVMIYIVKKSRISSPALSGIVPSALVGLTLGLFASFLGVGGGPINVALIIYLFNYPTKKAASCSLITILFSQAAKLLQLALTGTLLTVDLTVLPFMVVGAIAGGLLGARIAKGIDEAVTDKLFQAAQVLVLLFCIVNILKNL